LKASGGSLIRMMLPLLIVAAFLTYGLYLYNNYVIPETNHQTVLLMYDLQRKKPIFAIEAGQFSDAIDGYTILARKIDTVDNTLHSVTIYENKMSRISRTINAESCKIRFSEDMAKIGFHFQNGEIHQSENDKINNYRLIKFSDYMLYSNAYGFGFQRSKIEDLSRGDREMKIEDMQKIVDEANEQVENYTVKLNLLLEEHLNYLLGISEKDANSKDTPVKAEGATILRDEFNNRNRNRNNNNRNFHKIATQEIVTQEDYISSMRRSMYPASEKTIMQFIFSLQNINANIKNSKERANRYEVEIHKKYAIPFACIVFILIGCPLGIITKGGNFGISAAITLFFYIVYWACLIVGEKFADRLIIYPFISMWFGNIVIGIVGIVLTIKANNESLSFSDIKIFKFFKRKPTG